MAETVRIDGSMSFTGGVNSIKPTTIQSARHPDGLGRNQLAWLTNATVRGGGITCRNGWKYLCTVRPTPELYQGGSMYEPDGADPYLVLSIAGRLYRVRVDTNNSVDELSSGALLNPAANDQSFFIQGERFLVVQAGDNITLPLFWDGSTLRRSNGLSAAVVYHGTVTNSSWTYPAAGSSITLTFSTPFTGALGDTVIFPQSVSFSSPGVVSAWSGAQARWTVTAIAGADVTLRLIDTLTPLAINSSGSPVIHVPTPELPAATAMDYYMGRIWYARGRTYAAGDIVKGTNGTLAYNFFDSILKVTENPLAVGGDGFTVPGEAGNIRALAHTAEINTQLGQGQLYVFTRRSIYRLSVPVSRDAWIESNDATQPLQTVAQLRFGSVGDRCVVQVNDDLFYQTMEPAIRSLALAIRNAQQWGSTPISRNEHRVLRFNDRELLRFSSGIVFDNRLFQTALPTSTPAGVGFQAIVPLDFDLISTLEEKLPPAWEGIYEGLDILQLFEADFGGLQRAFAVVRSREDDSIQVWEITDHLKTDINLDGEARVTWIMESPAYTWDQEFLLKRLVGGELWIDRIHGDVVFKVEYRPDGDACWHLWNTFRVCSARNSCEDVNNPVCYPITPYDEGYRQTISMPRPQGTECNTTMGRPTNVGYQFQVKITVTGWCRIRGLMLKGEEVEQTMYHNMVCPGTAPRNPDLPEPPPRPQPSADQGNDPILLAPYPVINYQLFVQTNTGANGVPQQGMCRLHWTKPSLTAAAELFVRFDPLHNFRIYVTNYYQGTDTISQASNVVTVTSGAFRFINTSYNAGEVIRWRGGGQTATVVTVLSPTMATVDVSQTVAAGQFNVIPPGTLFQLWWFNGTAYQMVGDSLGQGGSADWNDLEMYFDANVSSMGGGPWEFYVTAVANGTTIYSNTLGYTRDCSAPAPRNFTATPTGPQSVRFTWAEGGSDFPVVDYMLGIGTQSGGPYNYSQSSVYRELPEIELSGFDAGTYYAVIVRRDSATCASNASNEVTFSLP